MPVANAMITDSLISYSSAPESAFGVNPILSANFKAIVTRARLLPMPSNRKEDDTGVIGRSGAGRPSRQRSELMNPINFEIQDRVNSESFADLLVRYMGADEGASTVVEAAKAWKHRFIEQDPVTNARGRQLPSTSFIYSNNGADFVHPGCVGASVNLSQTGAARPEYTMAFNNGGLYKRVRDIVGLATPVTAPAAQNYMNGAESRVTYTDPTATRNLVVPDRKLKSVSFSANNNLDLSDERAGLPSMDAGCPVKGWYKDYLLFGDPTVSAQMRVMVDANILEWKSAIEDEQITNWTWDMTGDCVPTTATSTQYGVKLIIPKCHFRDVSGQDDSNKSAMDIAVFPELNSLHYGSYYFEITNGQSAIHA